MQADKPIVDMSEKELLDCLRTISTSEMYSQYSYNDVRFELERKRSETWSKRGLLLSIVAIIISVASLIVGLLSR